MHYNAHVHDGLGAAAITLVLNTIEFYGLHVLPI